RAELRDAELAGATLSRGVASAARLEDAAGLHLLGSGEERGQGVEPAERFFLAVQPEERVDDEEIGVDGARGNCDGAPTVFQRLREAAAPERAAAALHEYGGPVVLRVPGALEGCAGARRALLAAYRPDARPQGAALGISLGCLEVGGLRFLELAARLELGPAHVPGVAQGVDVAIPPDLAVLRPVDGAGRARAAD